MRRTEEGRVDGKRSRGERSTDFDLTAPWGSLGLLGVKILSLVLLDPLELSQESSRRRGSPWGQERQAPSTLSPLIAPVSAHPALLEGQGATRSELIRCTAGRSWGRSPESESCPRSSSRLLSSVTAAFPLLPRVVSHRPGSFEGYESLFLTVHKSQPQHQS